MIKLNFLSYHNRSKNTGAIGSVLEEKSSFRMPGLTFSSKLDWGSYIISIAKTVSKKIGALIRSINLPYDHVWNTVVMSGLVLLVATWNCWISYRNGYAGLLALHLLLLLYPGLIVET